uniref:Chlorophyll a-b binding protein, chloroplastic n=1 Tax=Triticum urartu TaxID=4572 RepID=A0A8R7QMB2_TRIUA
MAAQGLLSGRQLLGRPLQSSISRSSSSRKSPFVVRASSSPPAKQNDNRQLWFASKQSLTYLDGTLPGDFGFDPLGLSDPEGTGGFIEPRWLAYGEIFNGRTAMMGVVGMIAPEALGKVGLVPPETAIPWFQAGHLHRRRALPEPPRPPLRPRQQQHPHQPQVPLGEIDPIRSEHRRPVHGTRRRGKRERARGIYARVGVKCKFVRVLRA